MFWLKGCMLAVGAQLPHIQEENTFHQPFVNKQECQSWCEHTKMLGNLVLSSKYLRNHSRKDWTPDPYQIPLIVLKVSPSIA